MSMLIGNLVSILGGGAITIAMSLAMGRDQPADDIWENTRDIDNPLRPWSDFYVRSATAPCSDTECDCMAVSPVYRRTLRIVSQRCSQLILLHSIQGRQSPNSHDATSPPFLSLIALPPPSLPFLTAVRGYHPGKFCN